MTEPVRFFSMFSGVGGFEYGIAKAIDTHFDDGCSSDLSGVCTDNNDSKWRGSSPVCVGFSEIDKYASAVLRYRFPEVRNYGDATKINPEELPDFDMLVGGFPCQSFSIAGSRGGFNDTRGTLFFEIARIVREKQPRILLLENVKGLLSHDEGNTFLTIVSTLDELGYDVEWQVLNSKNHGVPQNRERVFIVGHLRGSGGRPIFPLKGVSVKNDIGIVSAGIISEQTRSEGNYLPRERVFKTEGVSRCVSTSQSQHPLYAIPTLTPDREKKRQNGRRFKDNGDEMFTLTSQDVHGVRTDEFRIRKLTPVECERLQGFPDDWTKYGIVGGELKEMSDTQRYKMMGNAVTTNVIANIFGSLFVRRMTND